MNKRRQLAKFLVSTRLSSVLAKIVPGVSQSLVIYAYHRVVDTLAEFPFDLELVSASSAQFEDQVAWLARYTTPMTMRQLADCLDSGRSLPRRPTVVTFDDGFLDNYTTAYPILRKHGVPATFFVSTDYIGSSRTFWFDWLAHMVLSQQWTRIRVRTLDLDLKLPVDETARRQLVADLLVQAKGLEGNHQLNLINEVLEHQDRHTAEEGPRISSTMDWDMLREMQANGMEIGSHGVSHYLLAKLEHECLVDELERSKARLDDELGRPTASIAYPVGSRAASNDAVFRQAADSGYRIGVVYDNGRNSAVDRSRMKLSRKKIERGLTQAEFVCFGDLPWLY